jgi:phage-related baseplate assembly protein
VTLHVSTLFTAETAANLLKSGLEIAQALGLPTTTWRVGDPTRAAFKFLAEVLGLRETVAAAFARSGFLSSAEGDWLTLLASEVYGVDRVEATYATSTLTLSNSGGGYYDISPGDVTVASSVTGATYRNTTSLTLSPGTTGTVDVVAEEAGSGGTALEDDIDTLVTTMLGVTVLDSSAAVGTDEQGDEALRTQCLATLGALSPNGPRDAYEYVARNPALTGELTVTRAQATANSATGTVAVYVATPTGAPSGPAIAAVQAGIDSWATPLTVTATVMAATEVPTPVTATVSGEDIPPTFEADATAALQELFAEVPIGGTLARSAIVTLLHRMLVSEGVTAPSVSVSVPPADVTLTDGQVITLGAVSVTEV